MITVQRYNTILSTQGVPEGHSNLTDLIYSRGEEQMTEPLAKRVAEIICGIDEGNYQAKALNDFTESQLGIEGQVLTRREFSIWKRK